MPQEAFITCDALYQREQHRLLVYFLKMTSQLWYGICFLGGLVSHVVYFQRGEHHLLVTVYLQAFVTTICFTTLLLVSLEERTLLPSFVEALGFGICFLLGIVFVSLVYRVSLHPLNKFPGPIGARLSTLWLSYTLRSRDSFRQIRKLHDQYGPFVRLGPDYLSIAHPDGVPIVYGPGSRCSKAAWYDLTYPIVSLQTFRNKSHHDARRRVWSGAFSDKALRGYEQRLQVYQQRLIQHVTSKKGQSINVSEWFSLYSFDVMGDLAFGKSFDLLDTREH